MVSLHTFGWETHVVRRLFPLRPSHAQAKRLKTLRQLSAEECGVVLHTFHIMVKAGKQCKSLTQREYEAMPAFIYHVRTWRMETFGRAALMSQRLKENEFRKALEALMVRQSSYVQQVRMYTGLACAGCPSDARIDPKMLKQCGRCRLVYYCCKEHQEANWPQHKAMCLAVTPATTATASSSACANMTSTTTSKLASA